MVRASLLKNILNEKIIKNSLVFMMLIGMSISTISAKTIKSIQIEGLNKTNKEWISGQLFCKEEGTYDDVSYERDLQYLKDLNLFLSVYGKVDSLPNEQYNITFFVEESLYFYPILNVKRASNINKIQLGGSYDHFLGMKGKIGGYLEYYDKLSFVFYHDIPLHFNQKTGHYFSLSKRSTVEPIGGELDNHTIDFSLFTIGGGGYYHWKPRFVSKFGAQYFNESYLTQYEDSPLFNEGEAVKFNKVQVSTGLTIDKRHYHEEMLSGYSFDIEGEYIKTFEFDGIDGNFFKFYTTIKYYTTTGKTSDNIALRAFLGSGSNGNIPLPPFVLDNFINLRGIGNRSARGTGIMGFNLEYRLRLLKHPYFFLQGLVFSDFASIRPRLGTFKDLFEKHNISIGNGVGLRIQMRKFYHTVLSVDYSIPSLNKTGDGGFVFGIGQYF